MYNLCTSFYANLAVGENGTMRGCDIVLYPLALKPAPMLDFDQ